MEILGMLLMGIGFIVMAAGGIWLLVVTFQESILWGVGSLLLPLVGLIFVATHWDTAGKPFLIQLAGIVPLIAGMALMPSA